MSAPENQALLLDSPCEVISQISTTQEAESPAGGTEIGSTKRPYVYNNGYGDFCFLRLADGYPKPPIGAVDPEFIREGEFPFMRLPREIRDEIYKLVLAPILHKNTFSNGPKRELVLNISNPTDEYYCFKASTVRISHDQDGPLKAQHPDKKPTLEEDESELAMLCTKFLHPTRARYQITFPLLQELPFLLEKIPPHLLASIRNLSNVSCQIRLELATCAWDRSSINVGYDYAAALAFFKERPSIWKGIKLLSIPIFGDARDLHTSWSEKLLPLMEFIDQHLQLDLLMLRFEFSNASETEKLVEALCNPPKWVHVLRNLHHTKAFNILSRIGHFQEYHWRFYGKDYHNYHKSLAQEWRENFPSSWGGDDKDYWTSFHMTKLRDALMPVLQPMFPFLFSISLQDDLAFINYNSAWTYYEKVGSLEAFRRRLQADGSFKPVPELSKYIPLSYSGRFEE